MRGAAETGRFAIYIRNPRFLGTVTRDSVQPVQLQIAVRTHARCGRAPVGGTDMLEMYCVKGLRRWCDRFGQYGKVSSKDK